jgi:hypothetical protein
MRRLTIDRPTKIILDGSEFLLEPGDVIVVNEDRELTPLEKAKDTVQQLYGIQSNIDASLREKQNIYATLKSKESLGPGERVAFKKLPARIKKLKTNRKRATQNLGRAETHYRALVASVTQERESAGYGHEKASRMSKEYLQGATEEAEAEEKTLRTGEMKDMEGRIAALGDKRAAAVEALQDVRDKYTYNKAAGEWYQTPEQGEEEGYDIPLTRHEAAEMEQAEGVIDDLESQIELLKVGRVAQMKEMESEGDDEFDLGGELDFVHSIVPAEKLSELPDEEGEFLHGDEEVGNFISKELIKHEFQPKEFGLYGEMLASMAGDESEARIGA